MRLLLLVASALCSAQAAAFSLSPTVASPTGLRARSSCQSVHTLPLKVGRQSRQICRVRGTGPLTMMEIKTTDVDVKEYIKIFGRLGEKMIFGDASAGLCCHSACENCEWRYSFDVLQSARPKWIPTYRVNKFEDGREHIAKWSAMFAEGDDAISKEQFCERLAGIKFEMPLGPAGFLTAKQADVSPEALDAFWAHMSRGKASLTPKQMQIRLKKMLGNAGGDEGVMWPDFIDSLTADDDAGVGGEMQDAIVVAASS